MTYADSPRRSLTAIAICSVLVSIGSVATARADEPSQKDEATVPTKPTMSPSAAAASADEKKEDEKEDAESGKKEGAKKEEAEEEPGFILGLEFVIGFGKVDAVNIAPNASLTTLSYVKESTPASVVTPILSLSYPITKLFRVGARIPFVIGQINPSNDQARGAANMGNIELEGEIEKELTKTLGLQASLGLALPTARGDELPEQDTLNRSGSNVDTVSADRYSINHAAAFANGGENNALFEPGRFGIIPRVGVAAHFGHVKVEPYVKVENLIAISDAPHPVIVELVAGTRLAYGLTDWFDVGARVWGNFTLTNHDGRDLNIGVVEPEIRATYKVLHATLGGLIPFAGEPAHPLFGGVRLNFVFMF